MNMRKKEYFKRRLLRIAPPITWLFWCGAPPILLSALTLLHTAEQSAPLTAARANYLGKLLEYPAAALMILTAGAVLLLLAERDKS